MKTKTRKLVADIPEDLFKVLKVKAAETDVSMKDIVAYALRQHLKGGEPRKKA
jgi:plasmid stability protein